MQAVTKRKLPVVASDAGSQQPRHRQADTGRRWPHPDARPVLDGLASPPPGKLRRVPTLVNANHIPFLRFKKPQSPFLSYIIQEKNDEREKRIDKVEVLKKQLAIADDEDQWDRILREDHQISTKTNGIRWDSACREALMNVKRVHHTNTMKRMHIAQRMFNILQQQKELADKDRLERRDRRHQAYKARRRLREAAAAAAQDVAAKKDNPEASAAAI